MQPIEATRPGRPTGFTFVELLVVIVIMGLLANMAFPRYRSLKQQALAGRAAADFHAVKLAAYAYHTQNQQWPAEVGSGVVPPEIVDELPSGFDFHRGEYTMDWENWQLPNGLPQYPARRVIMALSFTSADSILRYTILNKLGRQVLHFTAGNTITFAIVEE